MIRHCNCTIAYLLLENAKMIGTICSHNQLTVFLHIGTIWSQRKCISLWKIDGGFMLLCLCSTHCHPKIYRKDIFMRWKNSCRKGLKLSWKIEAWMNVIAFQYRLKQKFWETGKDWESCKCTTPSRNYWFTKKCHNKHTSLYFCGSEKVSKIYVKARKGAHGGCKENLVKS